VFDALLPSGRWWQHRYLGLLCQKDVAAASAFQSLRLRLAAEFEPHSLRLLVEQRQDGSVEDEDGDDDIVAQSTPTDDAPELLELARHCGAVDAEAALLARTAQVQDALQLCLGQLGDVGMALRLVDMAPGEQASQAWDCLVSFAASDSRVS